MAALEEEVLGILYKDRNHLGMLDHKYPDKKRCCYLLKLEIIFCASSVLWSEEFRVEDRKGPRETRNIVLVC